MSEDVESNDDYRITKNDLLKNGGYVIWSVPKIGDTRYETRAWSLLGYIGPEKRFLN